MHFTVKRNFANLFSFLDGIFRNNIYVNINDRPENEQTTEITKCKQKESKIFVCFIFSSLFSITLGVSDFN